MKHRDPPRGLCPYCAISEGCTYKKSARAPVRFCEEFVGLRPPKAPAAPAPKVAVAQECREPNTLKGLCRDCQHVEYCTFPKPEGGVWHCEEFE